MNISEIKERVGRVLRDGFDHKFLNEDNKAFAAVPPTAENIARQLFIDAAPLFSAASAKLVACHLSESEERSATYFGTGASESNYWFEFSAARQTMSPRLTPEENQKLFGVAASPFGHGHNYRARLTFRSEPNASDHPLGAISRHPRLRGIVAKRTRSQEFESRGAGPDRINRSRPRIWRVTFTNGLAKSCRIHRVRLHERDDFFAEHWNGGNYFLGLQIPFSAAHRLHSRVTLRGRKRCALRQMQ